MNKAVIAVVLVVVVAVAGVGIYLMQNINPIVKGLIEDIGSDVTNTAVRVDSVDISLTEGAGTINGLTVANPAGFADDAVFSLKNISVQLDTGTLTDDVIIIRSVGIDGARVLTEHKGGGTNIQALRNGMDQSAPEEPADGTGARENRFGLQRMTFTNGTMSLKSDVLGNSDVELPDFTVTELGTDGQGMTAEELGSAIASSLIRQVTRGVLDAISDLTREQAMEKLKGKAGEGLDKLKGLFNRDEKAEEAATTETE